MTRWRTFSPRARGSWPPRNSRRLLLQHHLHQHRLCLPRNRRPLLRHLLRLQWCRLPLPLRQLFLHLLFLHRPNIAGQHCYACGDQMFAKHTDRADVACRGCAQTFEQLREIDVVMPQQP